jgi:hypothetical protein
MQDDEIDQSSSSESSSTDSQLIQHQIIRQRNAAGNLLDRLANNSQIERRERAINRYEGFLDNLGEDHLFENWQELMNNPIPSIEDLNAEEGEDEEIDIIHIEDQNVGDRSLTLRHFTEFFSAHLPRMQEFCQRE